MGLPKKEKGADIAERKPQFFIVIVSPALQLRKLKLPKKFAKNHGKRVPSLAYLRAPNGADFLVELLKCGGEVWLHRGWKQFAEHYSLALGHFLVFSYDGSSRFRVLIFDSTAMEIDYLSNAHHRIAGYNTEFEGCTSNEISDDFLEESKEQGIEVEDASTIIHAAMDRALQSAEAFKSQNPSFTVVMRKSYLPGNVGPAFPVNHCREYFLEDEKCNYIVLHVNEKNWHVRYRVEKNRNVTVRLSSGWKQFAVDNDLQKGDVCVFELINLLAAKAYRVNMFRVSNHTASHDLKEVKIKANETPIELDAKTYEGIIPSSCLNETTKESVLQKARNFIGGKAGFIILVRWCYVKGSRPVHVPVSHARMYLKDDGDNNAITIHGDDQKTWQLKYEIPEYYPKTARLLSNGWHEFRLDNHLCTGDVCVFQVMEGMPKSYKADIFRANEG